jgi:coenzyme F420-0:L-glutamate ligase/coenzyme F420-1:gamma-L-glutamate ligase
MVHSSRVGEMNSMTSDFYRLIYGRRSVRYFDELPVDKLVLRRVLETAIVAPSAHNSQPERFYVIPKGSIRTELVEKMAETYLGDLINDNIDTKQAQETVERSKTILLNAPVLILVGLTMRDMWKYPDEERKSNEYVMAVQSTAASIQNLLLSAHSEGLSSCWLCAPLFAKKIVIEVLGLDSDIDPQAFIVLGYSSQSISMPLRKPFEEIVHILEE